MCSGRVDLEFIFRAFANGQDGVFIGGCRLGECNYITNGNFDALGNVYIAKKLLQYIGLDPERVSINFMSGADGNLFAEFTDEFSMKIKVLGPLGVSENIDEARLKLRLGSIRRLIPYIRVVESQRLRVPQKSKELYDEFFKTHETNRMFDELIGEKLVANQIMTLLKQTPLPAGKIAETLGLSPSQVSRRLKSSARQGYVGYDESRGCYSLR